MIVSLPLNPDFRKLYSPLPLTGPSALDMLRLTSWAIYHYLSCFSLFWKYFLSFHPVIPHIELTMCIKCSKQRNLYCLVSFYLFFLCSKVSWSSLKSAIKILTDKTQRYSIYDHKRQRKASKPNNAEGGMRELLVFLHEKWLKWINYDNCCWIIFCSSSN